ncbi:MAG: hypothetical protein HYS17_11325 [Micavibrio aeruginosavorus]|uniref:Lipoprotein n=1 Tax=Micavibrio aeruginosavorus TaxID=349221 RepID=A0A7T5R1Y9_9BACT|nr:MAG: hypothetical protein HYS17_11325 [Micavibrio aeruginosavorus]
MSLQNVRRFFSSVCLSSALLSGACAASTHVPKLESGDASRVNVYLSPSVFMVCGKDSRHDYGVVVQIQSTNRLHAGNDLEAHEKRQGAHINAFHQAMVERWQSQQRRRAHALFKEHYLSPGFEGKLKDDETAFSREVKVIADDLFSYALRKIGDGGFELRYDVGAHSVPDEPQAKALCNARRQQGLIFN